MCPAAPSRRLAARCVTPRRSVLILVAISALCLSVPVLADGAISTIERVKGSVVAVGTFERTRVPAFQFRATGFAVGDGSLVATNAHALPAILDSERRDRKSTRLNSSHTVISYAVFCLKKKNEQRKRT